MTAPDLVEVVAEALLSVELDRAFDRNEDMVAFKEDLEACRMDARAVLAALTEAGTVEWGVRWGDGTHVWTRKSLPSSRNQIEAGGGVLVSRLVFPWTAVE